MKKITLISGSNRKGNTEFILNTLNKNLQNSELILLKNRNIEFCKGCLACHKIDKCVINDDINSIIKQIMESDLIVFGVPNYFDNVSGLFKNFMDRLHPLYKSLNAKNKKVIFIYVGGGGEQGTLDELQISVKGFVKYLELDVIKEYSFKALNSKDIEEQEEKILNIIEDIKKN